MKSLSLVFLFLLLVSHSAIAANPSNCGWYDVGCVANQFGVSDYGNWTPPKGRILYFGDEKRFQADLYFDQTAVDFYQANPWAGFEIDIIPITGSLSMIRVGSVMSDNPDCKPLRDTIVGDWESGTRGITVTNPSAIGKGWVSFSFELKNDPPAGTTIRANIQLVANALNPTFVDRLWDNNSWWWFYNQYWEQWFRVAVAGNMVAYVMPGGGEEVFSFFSMADAEQAVFVKNGGDNFFYVNSNINGEGMYWTRRGDTNDYAKKDDLTSSYTALNMPDLLPSVYDVNVSFAQKLMQDILDQLTSDGVPLSYSIDSETKIFVNGNHTHIVHDDYRCSKEANGPILCWESGLDPNEPDGRRNCWNGWKWYQFNGEVSEVADHRTDSSWLNILDRSMCAQVYNSSGSGTSVGGNVNNTTEGTGNGYNSDPNDNTWAGYDHHVGLNYLKIGKKSSSHWSGSKVWSINQIPDKKDFRVKLKRKGGKWKDVCAEVWFSHNKYFTDDDKYLGKECKRLSKKKYRKKKKKSVYVKHISIPKMEAGKNYYFFTRVTYHGGVNPSSRSDNDEYVKVEIIDFSSKFKRLYNIKCG